MTGSAAALVSFAESSGLLRELAEVEVSASQVERDVTPELPKRLIPWHDEPNAEELGCRRTLTRPG